MNNQLCLLLLKWKVQSKFNQFQENKEIKNNKKLILWILDKEIFIHPRAIELHNKRKINISNRHRMRKIFNKIYK